MSVTGLYYAQVAYGYRNSGYTYEQYDCIGFVNLCRSDCNITRLPNGTNTAWRDTGRFIWQGTTTQAINRFGSIPQGATIWKCIDEGEPGYDTIPPQYYGDGIGNFTHVGIFTNLGMGVMQSGGYGGTGVHESNYNANYWTHVGLVDEIYYAGVPYPSLPMPVLTLLLDKKRKNKSSKILIR